MMFFILGLVFFVLGVLSGEIKTGFIVVFPFLVGSGVYAFLGVFFVIIAILLFMFGLIRSKVASSEPPFDEDEKRDIQKEKSVKGGGVVLIGPVPIVFGSNWKIAVLMMVLAIIIIVAMFFLPRFL